MLNAIDPQTAFRLIIEPADKQRDVEINIDAQTARRRVSGWVMTEVANMLLGGTPELLITSTQAIWRVPVILTSKNGAIGTVGSVDVNASNGTLTILPELSQQLTDSAVRLAHPHHA